MHTLTEVEYASKCLGKIEVFHQSTPFGLVNFPDDEICILWGVESDEFIEGLNC